MFKKTSKSKKSTLNRDTLLIIQIFVLILIILLIIKQLESFKNKNQNYIEGFVDNQDDTVILHIKNNDISENKHVRLGNLDKLLNIDNNILSNNFNFTTLSTYNLFKDDTEEKTSEYFKNNTITHITLVVGYSAILYDGFNFDNNKRSILIDGNDENQINLDNYDFSNKLSSIKVFRTNDKYNVLKREANYNNQILLFSDINEYIDNKNLGEISRINLPTEKMKNKVKIKYFYTIDNDSPIKPIYSIIIPGSEEIDNREGVYRNINLTLYNNDNIVKANITESKTYDKNNNKNNIYLRNITHYEIIPQIPTLDTFTALNILKNNMVELEGLKSEFENIKNEQIKNYENIKGDQEKVVDELADNFIKKIQSINNNYNYKLYNY